MDQCSCIIHRVESKSGSKTKWWSSVWDFWKKKSCLIDSFQKKTLDEKEIFRNLCLAIQEGRSDYVKEAILMYPSLMEPETIQKLLLMTLHRGMNCTVDFFVEMGINSSTLNGALLASCKRGSFAAVEKLLMSGASVEARNRYRRTCLHLVAEMGDSTSNIVMLLLKHGADPSAADMDGKTPLHVAIRVCALETILILAEYGGNLKCLDNLGCSLLHEAMKRQIVFEDQDITIVKHPEKAYLKIVNFLVKNIPDIENRIKLLDNQGNSCIHYAAQHLCQNQLKAIDLLVDAGSPVNHLNRDGLSPLRLAVINHNTHVAEALLKLGADVDARAQDGSTALHVAVHQQDLNLVSLLLEFGADVDAITFDGSTPFQIALYWPETFLSKIHSGPVVPLIRHGANIFFSAGYRPNPLVNCDVTLMLFKPLNCILRILIYAATCHEATSLPIDQNDTNFAKSSVYFFNSCINEVNDMKKDQIENTNFYQILVSETDTLLKYLNNMEIMTKLESSYHLSKYSIYGPIINTRFRKALKRNELMKSGSEFFYRLFDSGYPALPEECILMILKFLKDSHLKQLQAVVLNKSSITRDQSDIQTAFRIEEILGTMITPVQL